MKKYLRGNLNAENTFGVIKSVIRVVTGWANYHGVSNNQRHVGQFLERTKRLILRWLNCRDGKRRVAWDRLLQLLEIADFPKKRKTVSMF